MIEDGQLMDLNNWVKNTKLDDEVSHMDSFVVRQVITMGKFTAFRSFLTLLVLEKFS